MTIPMANPKAQNLKIREDLLSAVARVFEDCHFILGENVTALEAEVAQFTGAGFGVAVNSGTDAILIALAACGIGPGDEVITTPFTFVATTEAIMMRGAKPVYVDIDPDTFNLDPAKIEAAVTKRTRAILPVHLYGHCADIDGIQSAADRFGLKVVYDGAQAIGSQYGGVGVGTYGDACTLSFFPTKNLGACGDGGMVLTNDADFAARCKSFRFHGMDSTYSYEYVGYCSRLDEIQAACLRVKLAHLTEWNDARRANAALYLEAFKDLPIQIPIPNPKCYHTYHQFTIRYDRRDELKSALAENGVGSAVYYPQALHVQRAYADLGYREGDFPESEKACAEVLSLPVHPDISSEDRDKVAEAVIEAVKSLG